MIHRAGAATVGLILALAVVASPVPAAAQVWIGVGPAWGYPAAPFYLMAPAPYVAYPAPGPPGFVPGRWVWTQDAWGQAVPVWVPPHLR